MSPSLMDTGDETNSPGSLSAEECNSNTAGSEREGEGQQVGSTGTRRAKNRDAARKTRHKQTERADELHEELQQLEQSNSALHKEIAALKKDLHRYTKALAHHEPCCRLRASTSRSRSTNPLSVFTSVDCETSSSPTRVAPQASSSILASAPSVSTSVTSGLELSSSASAPTAPIPSSSSGSPAELVIAPSSSPLPYSVPAPYPLFRKEPQITTRLTNVTPVCVRRSTSITSSTLTTAAPPQSGRDLIHKTSPVPANVRFSALNRSTPDLFLTKQSFLTFSSMVPPYPHLAAENRESLPQGCPVNVPRLHPGQYSGKSNNSNPLCTLSPTTPQDPAFQPLTVSPQANLELSHTFALKPGDGQEVASNRSSLLSLLTVPSPLNVSQTAGRSSGGFICHPLPSLPLWDDPSIDPSLSELLEGNDWILSGTSNQ